MGVIGREKAHTALAEGNCVHVGRLFENEVYFFVDTYGSGVPKTYGLSGDSLFSTCMQASREKKKTLVDEGFDLII